MTIFLPLLLAQCPLLLSAWLKQLHSAALNSNPPQIQPQSGIYTREKPCRDLCPHHHLSKEIQATGTFSNNLSWQYCLEISASLHIRKSFHHLMAEIKPLLVAAKLHLFSPFWPSETFLVHYEKVTCMFILQLYVEINFANNSWHETWLFQDWGNSSGE